MEDFQHFRVHTDELEIPDLLEFLNVQTDIQFVVKEYGKSNREHIHACIKLKIAKTTFVDRLKKRFPVIKGNKYYGLNKLKKDYDTNARYCYKGTASDWPDVLQSIHTDTEWKAYYNAYWEENKKYQKPVQQTSLLLLEAKTKKQKAKTFCEKILDELLDNKNICDAIWYYKGYKQDPNNKPALEENELQNFIADLLLQRLGKASKNIDNFIFERMFKGLWFGILSNCPKNLTKEPAIHMLDRFRSSLG